MTDSCSLPVRDERHGGAGSRSPEGWRTAERSAPFEDVAVVAPEIEVAVVVGELSGNAGDQHAGIGRVELLESSQQVDFLAVVPRANDIAVLGSAEPPEQLVQPLRRVLLSVEKPYAPAVNLEVGVELAQHPLAALSCLEERHPPVSAFAEDECPKCGLLYVGPGHDGCDPTPAWACGDVES